MREKFLYYFKYISILAIYLLVVLCMCNITAQHLTGQNLPQRENMLIALVSGAIGLLLWALLYIRSLESVRNNTESKAVISVELIITFLVILSIFYLLSKGFNFFKFDMFKYDDYFKKAFFITFVTFPGYALARFGVFGNNRKK